MFVVIIIAGAIMCIVVIVNPYDIDGVSDMLLVALTIPLAEQHVRMRAMRSVVSAHNVYGWAGSMLLDAVRSRQREQRRIGSTRQRRNGVSAARG